MQVDIDIVVFAVIAALLIGRLWSVLGTRNEDEPQRQNPFAPPRSLTPDNDEPAERTSKQQQPSRLAPPSLPPNSLAGGLSQVKTLVPDFDEKQFLQETRDIFTSVVGAFASGKLSMVGDFLSPLLMDQFQKAADARASAGHSARTRIVRIKDTEVIAARTEDKQAVVTVSFISEQENTLHDAQGTLIGGEEGKIEEIRDTWTFLRDTQQPGAKWIVVETRS